MSSPQVAGEQGWKVSVKHLGIAVAFDVPILSTLKADDAQTFNPAEEASSSVTVADR